MSFQLIINLLILIAAILGVLRAPRLFIFGLLTPVALLFATVTHAGSLGPITSKLVFAECLELAFFLVFPFVFGQLARFVMDVLRRPAQMRHRPMREKMLAA